MGVNGEKVNWLNVLQFYQPPSQEPDIVQDITTECYLPVSRLLLERPHAKAIININGCLLEKLNFIEPNGREVVENIKSLLLNGQVAISGTGKYNPVLPLIDNKEVDRQLTLQEEALIYYLGMENRPSVLFPPELAYLPEQMRFIREKGYRWVIVDDICIKKKRSDIGRSLLREKNSGIALMVRDRDMSEAISYSTGKKHDIDSAEAFVEHAVEKVGDYGFMVTATNVEFFGYIEKNRWKLLERIYDNPSVNSISARNIAEQHETMETETGPGSWYTNKQDISKQIYFPLWYHPQNFFHRILWLLIDIALEEVRSKGSEAQNEKMDILLSSHTFAYQGLRKRNEKLTEKVSDDIVSLLEETENCSQEVIWFAQSLRKRIYDELLKTDKGGVAGKT